MSKTTTLRAITKDGNIFLQESLLDEVGNYHSILTGLSWTYCIKEANNHSWYSLLFPVSDSEKLINRFGTSITPATFVCSTHHQIIIFSKRNLGSFTINFRC